MIIEKIYKHIDKQRQKKYPQHTNRCSSIGFPCVRKLCYDIVRRDAIPPIDQRLQVIFNEGTRQELIIQRDFLDIGIRLIETESPVDFPPKLRLFGHIDGIWVYRRVRRIIEIKTMSCYVFDKINTPDDFNKFGWHTTYMPQINLYMYGKELKKGLFILKNKNTGEMKEIEVELDINIVAEQFDKCLQINLAVDLIKKLLSETYQIKEIADFNKHEDFEDYIGIKNEACQKIEDILPMRINKVEICEICPFNFICLPDEIREQQARLIIDSGLELQLIEREKIKANKKRFDKLDEEIKRVAKESGYTRFICGDFEITVKRTDKKTTVGIEKL